MSQEPNRGSLQSSKSLGTTPSVDRSSESDPCPAEILSRLAPSIQIPPDVDQLTLWRMLISMIDPPRRKKLPQYNTLDNAVKLIKESKKIMILSGAGISTSAGIPDFRSRHGIYVKIHALHPDLSNPTSIFDIEYFRKNPRPFFQFAKELYPGQFKPTVGHMFIKSVEEHGKLLRNYTQNIDTLEQQAYISKVVECHGSFAKASCTSCKYTVDSDSIRQQIFDQEIPKCPKCHSSSEGPQDGLGVMKPNIVFFGELLGDQFHRSLEEDKTQVDLLIVIGSSLKVRPVALIPRSIGPDVPQILINKEPLSGMNFDIELLGNCDDIVQEICLRLGGDWTKICKPNAVSLKELVGPKFLKKKPSKANEKGTSKIGTSNLQPVGEAEVTTPSDSSTKTSHDPENTDALANTDQYNSDDDWEDIEVLDGSSDTSETLPMEKVDIDVPESSYIFLPPNKYVFAEAEFFGYKFAELIGESPPQQIN